ncbi:hypothetical protein DLAC_08141 [Tieghemostelium lacteum]|uniref:Ribosomal RNA methyltransferase FtsJ domain-containing protein n=1 Tax=Tieghemostelium lacteum TaxID=361077 RepID=A0A151ZBA9_TIELA|nr:hypothetical protein DLAC_08141 [Tieghemostelium lacteum]|eukprot:KYQ91215.1 hypothetical protein DLAC_08141 [Tieghemostelium lacteum]
MISNRVFLRGYCTVINNIGTPNLSNFKVKDNKEIKLEVFQNPKQYHNIRSLIVVKGKQVQHRDLLLEQLRNNIPKCGWNTSKHSDNIILGDFTPSRFKEFIDASYVMNSETQHKNILRYQDNQSQPFSGFSKQVLPNCKHLQSKSHKEWVDEICSQVIQAYMHCKFTKWRLQLMTSIAPILEKRQNRGKIEDDILDRLKVLNRPLQKLYNHATKQNLVIPLEPTETLVQVLFTNFDSGYISVSTPPIREYFSKMISYYPAGQCIDLYDRLRRYLTMMYREDTPLKSIQYIMDKVHNPYLTTDKNEILELIRVSTSNDLVKLFLPSKSFVKLFELELRYPLFAKMKKGESVIDLGSSPGGWTLYALLKECKVVSIDKSPLDINFLDYLDNGDPNLVFHQMDAQEYAVPDSTRFDWLLVDMKVSPMKSLQLLEKWLQNRHCKHFIVNLKLVSGDNTIQMDRYIKSSILPLTRYLNCHCLDSNGEKELTLFGTINKRAHPESPDLMFDNDDNDDY